MIFAQRGLTINSASLLTDGDASDEIYPSGSALRPQRPRRSRHGAGDHGAAPWQTPSRLRRRFERAGGEERQPEEQVPGRACEALARRRISERGVQQRRPALEPQFFLDLLIAFRWHD